MVCSWGCFCPVGRCLGAGTCSCSPEDKVKNPSQSSSCPPDRAEPRAAPDGVSQEAEHSKDRHILLPWRGWHFLTYESELCRVGNKSVY